MGDIKIVEGTFEVDGAKLHTKSWLPDGQPKAKLIVVHGFSDHIDRYYDFFPALARRGIAVHGFDQRGWGKSVRAPAEKGRTGPTTTVLSDIAAFIRAKAFSPSEAEAPVFVLGHSMGGGEVLSLASTAQYDDLVSRIRGWVLEAPFLGFAPAVQPSWLLVTSGRLAARVAPNMHLYRPVPPEHLCRDPEVQKSLAADTLLHQTGTLSGLAGMLDRAAFLSNGKLVLRPAVKSVVLLHGTDDKAASYEAAKAWWDKYGGKIEDATLKTYDGWAHQLHAEPGREEFYKDVGDWILARCDNVAGSAPEAKL
ncbi:alpha/beta-hydrolase [Hypomontagnella monticulosa]|nr:alpha/beta-hydrolase [Hypomontagnella monticulosa]